MVLGSGVAAQGDALAEFEARAQASLTAAATAWIDFAHACADFDRDRGIAVLGRALDHLRGCPDAVQALLYSARGELLCDADRPAEALADLTRAMPWLAAHGPEAVVVARANLAATWRRCGEYLLEREELEAAVAMARASQSAVLAEVLACLARVRSVLGDHDGALAALDESFGARTSDTSPLTAVLATAERARILYARGEARGDAADCAAAEAALRGCLRRIDEDGLLPPNDRERLLLVQALGACCHRRGALAEALRCSRDAVDQLDLETLGPAASTILFGHASLVASTGLIAEARVYMLRAIDMAARRVRDACASGSSRSVAAHHAELRSLLSSVLSCRDFSTNDATRDAEDLAAWLCGRGLSEWRSRRARRLAELAHEDAACREFLVGQRRRNLSAPGDATAVAQRMALDRAERLLAPRLAVPPVELPPDLHRLAAMLPPDAVLVVSATYQRATMAREGSPTPPIVPHVALFTLTATGAVRRHELGPADLVAAAVDEERRLIQSNAPLRGRNPDEVAPDKPTWVLGRLLAPALEALPDAVRTLVVCPDGALAAAPWTAIVFPASGRLGDRYHITYVDHPSALTDTAPRHGEPSLLLIGGIDFDCGPGEPVPAMAGVPGDRRWQNLPGSAAEIELVAEVFTAAFPAGAVHVLRQHAATWEALAATVAGRRYLHLSTHGFAAETQAGTATVSPLAELVDHEPLARCGLALAGANRDPAAGHASALDLSRLDLAACELAVLACCESNAGARAFGDALAGLAAAVRQAGARAVVATLWPIPDQESSQFLRWFYQSLWQAGATPAEALAHARTRAQEAGLPPACWAAFVHYGPLGRR
ncbi:MAG: CHAT domain-containing protein [Planctomycetes bacterium]|nr:CHAT domain-containing protein [Planctomycetota bacterium]